MFLAFAFLPILRQEALLSRTVAHLLFYLHATHGGCYACRSSPALAHMQDVTVADLLLHLHTCGMLHEQIFSGTCGHMLGSCASRSSPALAHMRVAMLADLLLHLHRSHARISRCQIFSCTCTHAEYYASRSSGALAHMQDATLEGLLLHLHLHTCRMLR